MTSLDISYMYAHSLGPDRILDTYKHEHACVFIVVHVYVFMSVCMHVYLCAPAARGIYILIITNKKLYISCMFVK